MKDRKELEREGWEKPKMHALEGDLRQHKEFQLDIDYRPGYEMRYDLDQETSQHSMLGYSDWQFLNPQTEMKGFSHSVELGEDPYAMDEYKYLKKRDKKHKHQDRKESQWSEQHLFDPKREAERYAKKSPYHVTRKTDYHLPYEIHGGYSDDRDRRDYDEDRRSDDRDRRDKRKEDERDRSSDRREYSHEKRYSDEKKHHYAGRGDFRDEDLSHIVQKQHEWTVPTKSSKKKSKRSVHGRKIEDIDLEPLHGPIDVFLPVPTGPSPPPDPYDPYYAYHPPVYYEEPRPYLHEKQPLKKDAKKIKEFVEEHPEVIEKVKEAVHENPDLKKKVKKVVEDID